MVVATAAVAMMLDDHREKYDEKSTKSYVLNRKREWKRSNSKKKKKNRHKVQCSLTQEGWLQLNEWIANKISIIGKGENCIMHAHVACVSNYKFPFWYFIAFSLWIIYTMHTSSRARIDTAQHKILAFRYSHMCDAEMQYICEYWDIANLVLIH